MYEELKEEKLWRRHFLVSDLCRQSFIAIIVCTNRLNSFTQILIINLIQCSFLLFAFKTSPFKFGFSVFNFIVCELMLTSILLEFLLIGIYDLQNIERINDRIKIGWAIICLCFSSCLFFLLYFHLLPSLRWIYVSLVKEGCGCYVEWHYWLVLYWGFAMDSFFFFKINIFIFVLLGNLKNFSGLYSLCFYLFFIYLNKKKIFFKLFFEKKNPILLLCT